MSRKRYDAFLFDLYGTLVDIQTDEEQPALWNNVSAFYRLHGVDITSDAFRLSYRRFCAEETAAASARLPAGQQVCAEPDLANVFYRLYADYGVLPSPDLVRRTAVLFRTLSLRKLRLFPGVNDLFDRLKAEGRTIILLSNAQTCFTLPELETLGLRSRFDGIVISSAEGVKKPSPLFFASAMKRYGLSVQTTAMVGNDADADCGGAAAVGLDSFYLHTEQSPYDPTDLPTGCRRLSSLLDLP